MSESSLLWDVVSIALLFGCLAFAGCFVLRIDLNAALRRIDKLEETRDRS